MELEGGERIVLKTLLDLQGDTGDYVDDARLAAASKMFVQDVRDWLETLGGKGFVERTRGIDGFSAYVTAKGKQALRLTEPISVKKTAGDGAPVTVATPGGTGAAPPQPVATQKTAPLFGIAPDDLMEEGIDVKDMFLDKLRDISDNLMPNGARPIINHGQRPWYWEGPPRGPST